MQYSHQIRLKVRDYECDMQAVVNNSVYQNYLEHARHEFLLARGINFAKMTALGINLVIIKAELEYKKSLVSNDEFEVRSKVQRISKLRFEFQQNIYLIKNDSLILSAIITTTSLNKNGRPFVPQELEKLLVAD